MQRERVGLIDWREKMSRKERGNTTTKKEMAVTKAAAAAMDLRGPSVHSFGSLAARSGGGGDTHTSRIYIYLFLLPDACRSSVRHVHGPCLCAYPLHRRCVLQESRNCEHCADPSSRIPIDSSASIARRWRQLLVRVFLNSEQSCKMRIYLQYACSTRSPLSTCVEQSK